MSGRNMPERECPGAMSYTDVDDVCVSVSQPVSAAAAAQRTVRCLATTRCAHHFTSHHITCDNMSHALSVSSRPAPPRVCLVYIRLSLSV